MADKKLKRRFVIFFVCIVTVLCIFIADLFSIQIVHAEDNTTQRIAMTSVDATIPAARGEFLDRNGIPLVTNKQVNNIELNAQYFPPAKKQEERNEILHRLIALSEKYGVVWNDLLPLEFGTDGKIRFKTDADSEIAFLKSKAVLHVNSYATAENCFQRLLEKFQLERFSPEEARKIASVCYSLKKISFSANNPFVFANEVSDEFAAKIEENRSQLLGVEVKISSTRQLLDGTLAPHIIGITGKLDAGEYQKHKSEFDAVLQDESLTDAEKNTAKLRAYSMDDTIGKFGLEAAMEDYLRGTNGIMTTVTDSNGIKTSEITKAPVNGDAIILTLDANLQKRVQDALAAFVAENGVKNKIPSVGSAVVIDVNTGGVLACATYPSYDLSTYYEDYAKLSKDKSSPLWNRALKSTYEPGSTMKPAIAIAGLEEGVIDEHTRFHCGHLYPYKGTTFKCLGHHGNIDVKEALNKSCNIFFYETGRLLGINKMNDYCTRFGLGQKTGVEIPESGGVLASPAYREAHGLIWRPGDTVQAAIGQSDNLFTPIQLANYAATIANGGKRYKAHFVQSVKSSDYETTVLEKNGEVLNEIGASQNSLRIVREGMLRLGTRLPAFKGLPVQVAAKTGTAESKAKVDGKIESGLNGFMISFAPFEKPEIAVAVAIENLNSGSATQHLVAEIYKAYFDTNYAVTPEQGYNVNLR